MRKIVIGAVAVALLVILALGACVWDAGLPADGDAGEEGTSE